MAERQVQLLIVDDEPHVRAGLVAWFREEGYAVSAAGSVAEAIAALRAPGGAEILLLDLRLPDGDGLELQRQASELSPDATVIIMTAFGEVETAVRALKQGAYDYVLKPCDPEQLSRLVRKAAERYALRAENRELRARLAQQEPALIGAVDGPMARVLEQVEQVADTDTSVLLTGESGTGKELAARLLHARSSRAAGPLLIVNCGALAEGVLESELFGHERGAFTGAVSRRRGKIELAAGGTLFLDEIGDVPAKVQIDLLRVLQERAVTRVGGDASLPVDFRLVTATHRDLRAEIDAGRFRADLYFRLAVFEIRLPPLRERREDISPLAEHFRELFARQMSRRIVGLTPAALAALARHDWPGNVRELRNAIERAAVVCRGGKIDAGHLPLSALPAEEPSAEPADLSLAAMEAQHIRRVLEAAGFNVSQAARLLGIDRVTLYAKMKRYAIERPG